MFCNPCESTDELPLRKLFKIEKKKIQKFGDDEDEIIHWDEIKTDDSEDTFILISYNYYDVLFLTSFVSNDARNKRLISLWEMDIFDSSCN